MNFETGNLTAEEIEAVFNNLPVEITFVDKEDTVRYFNQTKDKMLPRAKNILGGTVQNCHPEKSVEQVNKVINDFKNKKRDIAETWVDLRGKKVHIRYFAIRDKKGDYIGTMEIVQDITDIQKLKGEKRSID